MAVHPYAAIFVDDENLVFRYQAMVSEGKQPHHQVIHEPDTCPAQALIRASARAPRSLSASTRCFSR
jgi:hypothetical protein